MPMVKFRDCLASEVKTQEIIGGSFLVCRDTGDMWCDTLSGERIALGKIIHKVTGKVNSELFPEEGNFYYSTTDKQVTIYHDGDFQPINVGISVARFSNLACAKGSTCTEDINTVKDKLVGMPILKCTLNKLEKDISIADIETNVSGAISYNSATGIYTLTVTNASTTTPWVGSAEIFVFTTIPYIA